MDEPLAQALYKYLDKNDYLNEDDTIAERYIRGKEEGTLAMPTSEALSKVFEAVWPIIDSLHVDMPQFIDGRKPKRIPLNESNFARNEFQMLWDRINHKAVYHVEFDSSELIRKCIECLDDFLTVTAMQYAVRVCVQNDKLEVDDLTAGVGFRVESNDTYFETASSSSTIKYDLLGDIAGSTRLTRRTVAEILRGVSKKTFGKFRLSPGHFIDEVGRLIDEQKATLIVEHLTYDVTVGRFDSAIFTETQRKQDLSKSSERLKKHIYEYVFTDSNIERAFVNELDLSSEVVVYAKLPRSFFIPTPVGNDNPDWAIAFTEGSVKHVYFVAETKGSLSFLELKGIESAKIECASKFFASLSNNYEQGISCGVITDYAELTRLVTS